MSERRQDRKVESQNHTNRPSTICDEQHAIFRHRQARDVETGHVNRLELGESGRLTHLGAWLRRDLEQISQEFSIEKINRGVGDTARVMVSGYHKPLAQESAKTDRLKIDYSSPPCPFHSRT